MSQKFSIVIEVKNGKPVATAYFKVDAAKAVSQFSELRDAGKEAYLFQHPLADRRCKSAEQVKATLGQRDENGKPVSVVEATPTVPDWKKNEIQQPAPKKRGKNTIEGVSLSIDPNSPSAVDM